MITWRFLTHVNIHGGNSVCSCCDGKRPSYLALAQVKIWRYQGNPWLSAVGLSLSFVSLVLAFGTLGSSLSLLLPLRAVRRCLFFTAFGPAALRCSGFPPVYRPDTWMSRKERGGKKTKRSRELAEATFEGRHTPVSAPTSEASIDRANRVREGLEKSGRLPLSVTELSADPAPVVPKVTVEVRRIPKPRSAVAAPKTPPKAPPFSAFPPVVSNSGASSSSYNPNPVVPPAPAVAIASPSAPSSGSASGSTVAVGKPKGPALVVTPAKAVATPVEAVPKPKLRLPRKRDTPAASEVPKPKEEPVVAKAKVVIAKAKAKLSDPTTVLAPQSNPVASTVSIPADCYIRLSVDLHGVLDLNAPREGVWETTARSSLCQWLAASPTHQCGVCSYIGTGGPKSQQRRREALQELHRFNNDYHCDLRLIIEDQRGKPVLTADSVTCHIDDRLDLAWTLAERGVPCILVNPYLVDRPPRSKPEGLVICRSLGAALTEVRRRRFVPRPFSPWPGIFTTA